MQIMDHRDHKIQIDEDGYLIHLDDWDRELAKKIAKKYDVPLTAEHWWVIDYIREYYIGNGFHPTIRVVVNAWKRAGYKDRARDKYLYTLFPKTPIRLASKIAGVPHPPPGFVCL